MTFKNVIFPLLVGVLAAACDSGTRVKDLEPDHGSLAGDDSVVILGSGFQSGMTVYFGKRQARKVVIETPGRVRVKTPPGPAGAVDVVIVREDGKSFGLQRGFTYR